MRHGMRLARLDAAAAPHRLIMRVRLSWLLSAVALILVAAVPAGPAASDDLARGDAPQHDGLFFSPGSCEQGPEFCALTIPRAWAPSEIDLISAALDEIGASDLGRRIIRRAGQN